MSGTRLLERLADQRERDRIATDLDATLIVEAAAGTGKTTALVRRMVAAVAAGRARLDRIVAVTFTELAAGELKLRLRGEIERVRLAAAPDSAAAVHLRAALPQLEEARIGTIHSFCGDLLRERPVEAGVDPCFEVAPEDVAGELFRLAFDRWFEECLTDPSEAVRRMLRRHPRDGHGPRELLRGAAWELKERRDFSTPWEAAPFAREDEIDALMRELAALAAAARSGESSDYFTKSLLEIESFVHEVMRREAIRGRDYDGLEAELLQLARARHWRWVGFSRGPGATAKTALRAERARVHEHLLAFVDATGADLAPRLQHELRPVIEHYQRLKERAGRLDFSDLLLIARDLLRNSPAVRRDLQARFTHVFVDEFQDTDPLQAEILLLLAADDPDEVEWTRVRPVPGKLFLVGDPKQSIYRFRRADVGLYEEVKRRLVAAGAVLQHLTVSFRAVPEIQSAVNAALAPRMAGSASQATYVPLAPVRTSVATQPAIVALPVPAPYGDFGKVVDWQIERSLPDATAAFIAWLVCESGWTVATPDGTRVPIAPRHVCILFRRFRSFETDVTHAYVRALEARHLPHVLIGGSAFHGREEVEALRNVLAAIERPEDELAVFATLRGPFFALTDGALLAFHERFASLHPFRSVPDDLPAGLAEVAASMAVLRDLHRHRNRRPIADTIARFLAATRAHGGVAIWPTGEQALANVTRLIDMARRAERQGVTSFRAFVERLAGEAERGEASDAPIIEEGTGGVRLMTVHRAKGLEFPVVVLADLTAKETPGEPSRYSDASRGLCAMRIAGCSPLELLAHRDEERAREREEAARILYVAATRARDLLVVPVVGDERREGWLSALHPVIYPDEARRRRPETATPVGCPPFGLDSVARRSDRGPGRERSVAPGLQVPEIGSHRVVWWDPATLALEVEESVGLRQQRLLEADESGATSERGVQAHAGWQERRAEVRAAGRRPSLLVESATAWAGLRVATNSASGAVAIAAADVAVEHASGDEAFNRPHGLRFGVLVHAVLAVIDLDADVSAVEATTAIQARLFSATAGELATAVATVYRALRHPLMRRAAEAARAGQCRREVALMLNLEDEVLVEGVADLVFRDGEPAAWTVVDFKTDRQITNRLPEYRWQLGVYAEAVSRATGRPARAVILSL
jgi:ATP-dependent exoDNAse (exonuclease V) beta subunit